MTVLTAMLVLLLSGCSNNKKKDWYDTSQEMSQKEEDYIAEQQTYGVSKEEATADYWRKIFTINTEGKNKELILEGEELKRSVSRPDDR